MTNKQTNADCSSPGEHLATHHRITFSTQGPLAYVSVLELGRIWERTLRRANVPLKYSQGFNPRPKLRLASPLPVGCGGKAEWVDILLYTPWPSSRIAESLAYKTPQGLAVTQVEAVPEDAPAPNEQLIAATYHVWIRDIDPQTVTEAVDALLKAETLPRPRRGRKHRGKTYDLRPLIETLEIRAAPEPWVELWMQLTARPGATGRPDEVLKALGMEDVPRRCTRLRLILET